MEGGAPNMNTIKSVFLVQEYMAAGIFLIIFVKTLEEVKVIFALEQAMKIQRGSRGIAPLFL